MGRSVLKYLASESFITVNKDLIKLFGTDAAIIIGHFASCQNYFGNNYFFQTYEKIQEETGIKTHSARKAIKTLTEKNVILVKRQGVPCKTYYLIDSLKLDEVLNSYDKSCENVMTGNVKTLGLEPTKTHDINNNKDKNINNNKHASNVKEIVEYFNKKTNKKVNYKSSANQKLIKARLNEDYKIDDFKHIIDIKYDQWNEDPNMKKYIRLSTLFASSHFDNYLAEYYDSDLFQKPVIKKVSPGAEEYEGQFEFERMNREATAKAERKKKKDLEAKKEQWRNNPDNPFARRLEDLEQAQ